MALLPLLALLTVQGRTAPRLDPRKESAVVAHEPDFYVYDSVVGFLHKPHARRVYSWPEHPAGRIELRTNNLGFRKDVDTPELKKPGTTRVLFAGDSHTDGVVNNSESFAALLEKKLGPGFETLNGGVGYYGPQNYAAFLRRFLYLKPDVFVVTLYSGNDFLDVTRVLGVSPSPPEYFHRLDKARLGDAAWDLDQIYYFKNHPADLEPAVRFVEKKLDEMQALCARRGIKLIVLLLPTKFDVEPARCAPELEQDRATLGLSESDLGFDRTLVGRMTAWLEARRISFLDLSDALGKPPPEELYWKRDYHLNVRGHARVADAVYRAFARERELDPHASDR